MFVYQSWYFLERYSEITFFLLFNKAVVSVWEAFLWAFLTIRLSMKQFHITTCGTNMPLRHVEQLYLWNFYLQCLATECGYTYIHYLMLKLHFEYFYEVWWMIYMVRVTLPCSYSLWLIHPLTCTPYVILKSNQLSHYNPWNAAFQNCIFVIGIKECFWR